MNIDDLLKQNVFRISNVKGCSEYSSTVQHTISLTLEKEPTERANSSSKTRFKSPYRQMGQKPDSTQKKRFFHGFQFISAYFSYRKAKKRKRNTKPFVILKFQFFPIVNEIQFEGKFIKILM